MRRFVAALNQSCRQVTFLVGSPVLAQLRQLGRKTLAPKFFSSFSGVGFL